MTIDPLTLTALVVGVVAALLVVVDAARRRRAR